MTFQEQLNLYIEELSCSGRELAKNSGISETILSRYRKGERLPGADSDYLKKLAAGIALTAEQKGKKKDQESVLEVLLAALKQEEKSEIFYYQKFDILLRELEINVSKMASALHYDPSYISKIRTGKKNTIRCPGVRRKCMRIYCKEFLRPGGAKQNRGTDRL